MKEAHFELDALRQVVAERQQLLETLETEIVTLRAAAETHDGTVLARVDALQQELAVAQDEAWHWPGTSRRTRDGPSPARDGQITQLQQALTELANLPEDPSLDLGRQPSSRS